jgi:hypothetical protein
MRRTVLNAVAILAAVAVVIGCDQKTTIPTKLDQPIPTVAPPAGGGGAKDKGGGAAAKKKNVQPITKVD